MGSPVFKEAPVYIRAHGLTISELEQTWEAYEVARIHYARSRLTFNFKHSGMNNAEENLKSGNDTIRRCYDEYMSAKSELGAAHNRYKASMSDLIQGKRL